MKKLILAFLFLSSCSSVWVVEKHADGGVIGYDSRASEKSVWAASVCPNSFTVVKDEPKSSEFKYATVDKVFTTGSGTVRDQYGNVANYDSRSVSSVPREHVEVKSWREVTYRCR